ncbi:kinase-like domain-containing protein [Gautieria morchelliformis]|nr:kinase-like domain-containing protein [Gautieria morchelliformis]
MPKNPIVRSSSRNDQHIINLAEEEDVEDYGPGGYLNVKVDDDFVSPNRRSPYRAIRKLGWGHFSTVWLVLSHDDGRYAALKVSSAKYSETAKDEISLLMKARQCAFKPVVSRHGDTEIVEHPGARHVVSLLDYFSTRGRSRNESHVCMVLEPLGETLLNFLDRYRTRYGGHGELAGVPMNLVKVIAKQVLMGLEYLHDECGLVHTDIKPENILVGLPNTQEYIRTQLASSPTLPGQRVAIPRDRSKRSDLLPRRYVEMYCSQPIPSPPLPIELGSGSWDSSLNSLNSSSSSSRSRSRGSRSRHRRHHPINVQISDLGNATPVDQHYTEDIQTRQYRAPEAIIRRSDWGFPVDIWSVACLLFELATGDHLFDPRAKSGLWEKDDDHMAQIIELCGDFDLDLKLDGKFSRDIFTSRGKLRNIKHIKPVSLTRVLAENYNYHSPEAKQFAAFLSPMLRVDPSLRATAKQMMTHKWLETWDANPATPREQRVQRFYD